MANSSKQACEDLIVLFKHIKTNLEALAEQHGLTHVQLYVLNAISRGEMTMGEVAGNLHCDASNVTGIIDRLVTGGLVSRHEDKRDRRAKVLQLTGEGQKVLDTITAEMPEAMGCSKLTSAERVTFHDLIARLV